MFQLTKQDGWIFYSSCMQQNVILYHKRKVMTLTLTQHYHHLFSLPIFLPTLHDPLSSTTITGSSSTYHSNSLIL